MPCLRGSLRFFCWGHADGGNRKTAALGQIWYVTWDAQNLYIGIANANGNLAGFHSYDNTGLASLPFRAQFVAYFKDGYREYRRSDVPLILLF